jgi:homoserine O-acetyltransferase
MNNEVINRTNDIEPVTEFVKLFTNSSPLVLESGEKLSDITVAYQTYGRLSSRKDNAVLICHALTGNAHAAGVITEEEIKNSKEHEFLHKYNLMFKEKEGWWDGLIGPGKTFDTNKYYIISSNILGSCYGTTGPASCKDGANRLFNLDFPQISVRDMVMVQKKLVDHLGVKRIKTVTGGSLGGMQVLEWAAMYGELLDSIIPIATSAAHSPWAIGLGDTSRHAIMNDPNWINGNYNKQPKEGLSLARKIAMLSYRSKPSFDRKFGRSKKDRVDQKGVFQVESYLNHQGKKLVDRFDANTYLYLSYAMDHHNLADGRGDLEDVLHNITIPSLNIGINSDILYPAEEQKWISNHLANSSYAELDSIHGHDAFLIEFRKLDKIIRPFLEGN